MYTGSGFAGNCIISEHELSCEVWLKLSGINEEQAPH